MRYQRPKGWALGRSAPPPEMIMGDRATTFSKCRLVLAGGCIPVALFCGGVLANSWQRAKQKRVFP